MKINQGLRNQVGPITLVRVVILASKIKTLARIPMDSIVANLVEVVNTVAMAEEEVLREAGEVSTAHLRAV